MTAYYQLGFVWTVPSDGTDWTVTIPDSASMAATTYGVFYTFEDVVAGGGDTLLRFPAASRTATTFEVQADGTVKAGTTISFLLRCWAPAAAIPETIYSAAVAQSYAFQLVKGDTAPALEFQCTEDTGGGPAAVAFPAGSTAVLHAVDPVTRATTVFALTAVDLSVGTWTHAWSPGETDSVGVWLGQVHVTYPDATVRSYPSDGSRVRWRITDYV